MSEPKIIESETPAAVAGAAPCSASFTLDEVISAALKPFGGGREYGTPRPPDGMFCKLCGAEAVFGKVMKHDTDCLLWPHEMEATMTPNAKLSHEEGGKEQP